MMSRDEIRGRRNFWRSEHRHYNPQELEIARSDRTERNPLLANSVRSGAHMYGGLTVVSFLLSDLQSRDMFYRSDNRNPDQLRPVKMTPEFITTAEGSVLIEVGNTRVICTASIEETVPQFMRNSGKGWISSEYSMLPRSTLTRTPREVSKGRQSGRTHEIQRLIGRSLRAVADLAKLGERT